MPMNVLTTGTTAASSADVVVAAGDELTVCLKDAAGTRLASGATVYVQLKDDAGQYFTIDTLDQEKPARVIGAGTWRFERAAGVSCGVFSA